MPTRSKWHRHIDNNRSGTDTINYTLVIRLVRFVSIIVAVKLVELIFVKVGKKFAGEFGGWLSGWLVGVLSFLLIHNELSDDDKLEIRKWIENNFDTSSFDQNSKVVVLIAQVIGIGLLLLLTNWIT